MSWQSFPRTRLSLCVALAVCLPLLGTTADQAPLEKHAHRAFELLNSHTYDAAIAEFQQALRLDENNASLHAGLRGAMQKFQMALRIDPNFARAHYNEGLIMWLLGKPAEARREFERAAAIRGNSLFLVLAHSALSKRIEKRIVSGHRLGIGPCFHPQFGQAKQNHGIVGSEVMCRLQRFPCLYRLTGSVLYPCQFVEHGGIIGGRLLGALEGRNCLHEQPLPGTNNAGVVVRSEIVRRQFRGLLEFA